MEMLSVAVTLSVGLRVVVSVAVTVTLRVGVSVAVAVSVGVTLSESGVSVADGVVLVAATYTPPHTCHIAIASTKYVRNETRGAARRRGGTRRGVMQDG